MNESDDQMLRRPVVILGSPRSGTTILMRSIETHRDVLVMEEPRLIWRYGNDRKSDLLRPCDARPQVIAHIRGEFARRMREAGKKRLVEKTPSNSLRPEFVDRVLPECRFIHVMRHGVDAVLSIRSFWTRSGHGVRNINQGIVSQRLHEVGIRRLPLYGIEIARRLAPGPLERLLGANVWGPRIPGIHGLLRDLDLLEVCCLQWRMCVELTRQFGRTLPSDRYMEVRLEELSEGRFRELLRFAELDDDPAVMGEFLSRYDARRVGARKVDADPREVERIRTWIQPTLQWLGYE